MLKYFCGYWETTKIILLNISNNEIILDENFPDYGRSVRWLGNTKETTNFDDVLDGIDIKVLYRIDQHF